MKINVHAGHTSQKGNAPRRKWDGVYLSGNESAGYVAHIKIKNNSNSSIGPVTATANILWV